MLTWAELEAAAPAIAANGRALLERFQFVFERDAAVEAGRPLLEADQVAAAPDSHSFELLAERAAWVTYSDGGQTSLRWQAGGTGARDREFDAAHEDAYRSAAMLRWNVMNVVPVGGLLAGPRGR